MRKMGFSYLKFPILSALRRDLTRTHFFYSNFILSSSLKNHREHRAHREKWQSSVFSECSVVGYLCKILLFPREFDKSPIEQW